MRIKDKRLLALLTNTCITLTGRVMLADDIVIYVVTEDANYRPVEDQPSYMQKAMKE